MNTTVPPVPSAESVYLDHHASTPLEPSVLNAMRPWLERGYGNASNTLHGHGIEARTAIEWARVQVASLINATLGEIIFTSGATEANNMALFGSMDAIERPGVLVISTLEHESVTQPAHQLARRGHTLLRISGDKDGLIDPGDVEAALKNHRVTLLSIIAVQGEIGTINPIPELTRLGHKYGALVHTDAAQAVGKVPVDVEEWEVDYLTIAAHKMYGPKGVGALYKKREAPIEPLLYGAGHEQGLRPGTENVPYLVGFGQACVLAMDDLEQEMRRQRDLRDFLWQTLQEHIPEIRLNGHSERRHPGNLHLSLKDVQSLDLLKALPGYALSVGSACHSANPMENPLIQSLNIPEEYARGSIRIGLGRSNTRQQIEQFAFDFKEAYHKISQV
ncbi:MAG TPA: cysteine desulfurase family protein [bacterium]|nr:cysteine desulfurase family protein [bacterium]